MTATLRTVSLAESFFKLQVEGGFLCSPEPSGAGSGCGLLCVHVVFVLELLPNPESKRARTLLGTLWLKQYISLPTLNSCELVYKS